MLPYAYFLKELCSTKRATNIPKRAFLAPNVSSIISNEEPIKYEDPGCRIGYHSIHRALCVLGVSVNLLPFMMYEKLG